MYEIDFNTCTAADVIQRSITCHQSLFLDGMMALRDMHRNYANQCGNAEVSKIAAHAADDCAIVIDAIADDEISRITETVSRTVQAFTVAARLNLVPPGMRGEIIER